MPGPRSAGSELDVSHWVVLRVDSVTPVPSDGAFCRGLRAIAQAVARRTRIGYRYVVGSDAVPACAKGLSVERLVAADAAEGLSASGASTAPSLRWAVLDRGGEALFSSSTVPSPPEVESVLDVFLGPAFTIGVRP